MCQGNGYLCLRNATDEFNPGEQRDLFVAGTFNKFDDNEVTELPNAADISRLDLRLDGVRFSLLTGKVESYDRALHLKNGETVRRVVWAAPNGKRYQAGVQPVRFDGAPAPHRPETQRHPSERGDDAGHCRRHQRPDEQRRQPALLRRGQAPV